MKIKALLISLIAAAGLMLSSGAHAAQWSFQPGAGHLWNGNNTLGGLTRVDGMIVAPVGANGIIWVVPVQLSATNLNHTGFQSTSIAAGASVNSRLAVFNSVGNFVGATAFTTAANIGTILVPLNGTMFTQTSFVGNSTLRSLRVTF